MSRFVDGIVARFRPAAPTPSASEPRIVDETVAELLVAVRAFLDGEADRASSLNARGSGLTGFVGIVLTVAAAAGAATGAGAGSGLDEGVRILVGSLLGLALVTLIGAVVFVVLMVLLPKTGYTVKMSEIEKYPTWESISLERVQVQGNLMLGYVDALRQDREINDGKARWLRRSYFLVCIGLVLVGCAATAATVDRYVAGPVKPRTQPREPRTEPAPRGAGTNRNAVRQTGDRGKAD
jgi:hypothetical protein